MAIEQPTEVEHGRSLDLIWMVDCSGSMAASGHIYALNNAMRDSIAQLRALQREHAEVELLIRVLSFSDGAHWRVPEPIPVGTFRWSDLEAGGETDMGQAFAMLTAALRSESPDEDALPPVLILVTDGYPTDDYGPSLAQLLDQPQGLKAKRLAIAIGPDAESPVLDRFINDQRIRPLRTDSPEALAFAVQETITLSVDK